MNQNRARRLIQVILTLIIQGAILFIAAGTVVWTWAWAFMLLSVLLLALNMIVLPKDVIEERSRSIKEAKTWDKVLASIIMIFALFVFITAGWDFRAQWTGNLPAFVHVSGLILYVLGSGIFTWAMASNPFFATNVQIRTDRSHEVATGGPYRLVRHPGYVGFMTMYAAIPLALGSLRAFVFSAVTGLLLILRTKLEDDTLKRELTGYVDYARKVKYRLIPYLW